MPLALVSVGEKTSPYKTGDLQEMNKRGHHLLALALSFNSFAAVAADQLVWSETFQTFPSFALAGSINTASVPGNASGALVTDPLRVKGPNGVEFAGGRVWWPDQQLNRIVSMLADGTGFKTYNISGAYDVDVQGGMLYVTRHGAGDILKLDLSLSFPPADIFSNGLTSPFAIDVTSDSVYWSQVGASNRVMRSNLDGTNVQTLLTGLTSYDFEVTQNYIYLTTTDGFVKRANLDGTGLTTLASGLGFLNGIDVTADTIYVSALSAPFTTPQGNPATGAGRILSMGLDGTGVLEVIRGQQNFDPNLPFSPSQVRGVAVLAVPEPSSHALLLAGLGLTGLVARRRRRV
jgi:hypothetical protein